MFVCANLIEHALANSHIVSALANSHIVSAKTDAIEMLAHNANAQARHHCKAADLTVDRTRLGESFGR